MDGTGPPSGNTTAYYKLSPVEDESPLNPMMTKSQLSLKVGGKWIVFHTDYLMRLKTMVNVLKSLCKEQGVELMEET